MNNLMSFCIYFKNKILYPKIQLKYKEVALIGKTLAMHSRKANFLVFGAGNDTSMWVELNKSGRTVFIEDDEKWVNKVRKMFPHAEIYAVNYMSKIDNWKSLLNSAGDLKLNLPQDLENINWDVILVDAPCGNWDPSASESDFIPAGRMSSIYSSSKLIKKGGDVFVHDNEREVERAYSTKYLGNNNLVQEVKGRGLLSHYKLN